MRRRVSAAGGGPGFTLIELMIVVAIIALLAAIAIPNFLTFQCRSKQSEVKTGLGSLYTTEKLFLSEHNTYTTDFVSMGWGPEGSPLYLYGFSDDEHPASVAGLTGFDPARNHTLHPDVVGSPPQYLTGRTVDLAGVPLVPSTDLPGSTFCGGQKFVVGAVADIEPDGGRELDQWIMDEKRFMEALPPNDCIGS